jgi:hypothetical protein
MHAVFLVPLAGLRVQYGVSNAFLNTRVLKGTPVMSDPRDRPVFGGARLPGPLQGPLNDHPFRQSRSGGLTGPPRGTIVVAEGPKSKKAAKPQAAPKVAAREISVFGKFDNPWAGADEVAAMSHGRWEPTSDDFGAVAGKSAVEVDSWKGLLQVILTNGDAESTAGSISRFNIFTHANSNLIALAGHVRPGAAAASVTLTVDSAISEETLDQLDSGIFVNVVSKNKKLASKKFVMDDVRKRFTKDAVIFIYACHGAVETAFVQRIADTFQVKVRAFKDVIGYYPSFDDADPAAKQPARVTNRRKVGVGYNSKVKVDDFHQLDSNAVERAPRALSQPAPRSDDDE